MIDIVVTGNLITIVEAWKDFSKLPHNSAIRNAGYWACVNALVNTGFTGGLYGARRLLEKVSAWYY